MAKQIKNNKLMGSEPKQSQNVQELALTDIMPNPNNPRKTFDENSIRELADSIKGVGLIQPITVRPLKTESGKYELIAGERRYRACVLLEWETAPCIVKDVSDEVAMEIAFIENLQREEVPVMEEAAAYKWLIGCGRYDYASLASKVGKSEATIRKRIKLTELVPELQAQVDKEVPLGHAEEICKYSEDIQREVAKKYTLDVSDSFRGLTLAKLKERLATDYTCVLSMFHFDQSECRTCVYNTGCNVLFDDDAARCQNLKCLKEKANQYIAEVTKKMMQERPELVLLDFYSHVSDEDLIETLNEKEIELQQFPTGWKFRTEYFRPEPDREDYETDEDYEQVLDEYSQEKQEQDARVASQLEQGLAEGTIFPYIEINGDEPRIAYYQVSSGARADVPTKAGRVAKLKEKAKRETELVFEKTWGSCREFMKTAQFLTTPLAEQETKLIYYIMLESLPTNYWPLFGITASSLTWQVLSDEQRLQLVQSLTEEQKRLIERSFICNTINDRYTGTEASLFVEWVRLNYPEDVASLEKKYGAIMKKRLDNIAAKLAVEGDKLPEEYENLRMREQVPAENPESETRAEKAD